MPTTPPTYAWCFDHGRLHTFLAGGEPWCTAAWVSFTASNEEEAITAKQAAFGDARFFDELPAAQQLKVIEMPGSGSRLRGRDTRSQSPG